MLERSRRVLRAAICCTLTLAACGTQAENAGDADAATGRARMVHTQLEARGIRDRGVLAAMAAVPRHRFVPEPLQSLAYADRPLPIGHDQTISQPYIVAFMTQALQPAPGDRVLEVGTGSGYQAAVLAELGCQVFSIEIVEPLASRAQQTLRACGYDVRVRTGDGYRGWPEYAPFDAILVTAAPEHVPPPLLEQLRPGGRMVLPVGGRDQDLVLLEKAATGTTRRSILPVRFVPMTGEAQQR